MKRLFPPLLIASIGFAQSFRLGGEGGVPLANAFEVGPSVCYPVSGLCAQWSYSSSTRRYTIGATAELDLSSRFAIKADALYKRLGFDSAEVYGGILALTTASTTANSWEVPLLAKYSLSKPKPLRPYVEAGVAFRTLQGVLQKSPFWQCLFCDLVRGPIQTNDPAELSHRFTQGLAAGAGLELRHGALGVFGEIRYTYWTADAFAAPDAVLNSARNQADLLVGVTF
jgi:hypothetical protein